MNEFWKDLLRGGLPEVLDYPQGPPVYQPTIPVGYPTEAVPPTPVNGVAAPQPGMVPGVSNVVLLGGGLVLAALVVWAVR